MQNKESDMQLWLRIGEGELTAFRELFDLYYTPLCRFSEFWTRDESIAEEIVLDLFTHLWQNADDMHISTSVRAYLFRAVRNRALNWLRRNKISFVSFDELESILISEDSLQIEVDDLMNQVYEAISNLPKRCQEIFIKKRIEHHSNAQIADDMHISIKTVEGQMTKAMRYIRREVDKI